jgi:hypothetical protein
MGQHRTSQHGTGLLSDALAAYAASITPVPKPRKATAARAKLEPLG